jgi:phosphoglycolate phosphatase
LTLFVFDFDGTLVDSNAIKRAAYYEAAADLPDARRLLDGLLAPPARGDRMHILGELARVTGRPEMHDTLLARYGAATRAAILARLADGWAASFLEALHATGDRAYISSATPADALADILDAGGLGPHLAGWRGGFGLKTENLRDILRAERSKSAVVVGDGADDARSAADCDCPFVRVDDGPHALFRRTTAEAVDWLRRNATATPVQ